MDKTILKLADSALAGDTRAAVMILKLMASKAQRTNTYLHQELSKKIASKSLRSANFDAPIPVDSDSRLQLVKVERFTESIKKPVHPPKIEEELINVIEERNYANKLREQMLEPTKSIIFDGPPGVGKTLTARWLASELDLPLITLDLATVMSSYLGKTGTNLRAVLDYASSFPSILLIDEFDALAKKRNDDSELGELKRLVTVLLQAIDDWPDSSILIAATNHGELLDPAIWRRFDLELKFSLPSKKLINQYLNLYWGNESFLNASELISDFDKKSFSYINREINRKKRAKVINKIKEKGGVKYNAKGEDYKNLSIDEKKIVAKRLYKEGYSQRAIERLIKLSRPTIKKAIEA